MKTEKVLIVDDELFVRQSFADFLEDNLWEPVQAESGEAALGILNEQSIPAAIVDIRLEGMPGEVFIRKALPLYCSMIFIICTGSPEYKIPADLLESGRVSPLIFNKPVSRLSDIVDEIRRMLSQTDEKDG